MGRTSRVVSAVSVLLVLASTAGWSTGFNVGLGFGLKGGFSYRATAGISDFARGFPFGLDLSATYSTINPGDPLRARRIFINQNTNGTPEKSGWTWDLRMDFMYNMRPQNVKGLYLFAGPRVSFFTADFNYVDGNEDFEVTSAQWGVGVGAKGVFSITPSLDLTMTAGVDGYFPATLYGHGTTYTPDDMNVNAKEEFTYKDAAAAIRTPRFQPVLMMGLSYAF
jgi:hypothetical protein